MGKHDTVTIEETLKARDSRYGDSGIQFEVAQTLKSVMHQSPNWHRMSTHLKESLEMIATKISRVLTGDPSYVDNWLDIEGYARLVKDRLLKAEQADHAAAGHYAGEHSKETEFEHLDADSLRDGKLEVIVAPLFRSDRNKLLDAQSYALDYAKSGRGNHVNAQLTAERLGSMIGRIDEGMRRLGL